MQSCGLDIVTLTIRLAREACLLAAQSECHDESFGIRNWIFPQHPRCSLFRRGDFVEDMSRTSERDKDKRDKMDKGMKGTKHARDPRDRGRARVKRDKTRRIASTLGPLSFLR